MTDPCPIASFDEIAGISDRERLLDIGLQAWLRLNPNATGKKEQWLAFLRAQDLKALRNLVTENAYRAFPELQAKPFAQHSLNNEVPPGFETLLDEHLIVGEWKIRNRDEKVAFLWAVKSRVDAWEKLKFIKPLSEVREIADCMKDQSRQLSLTLGAIDDDPNIRSLFGHFYAESESTPHFIDLLRETRARADLFAKVASAMLESLSSRPSRISDYNRHLLTTEVARAYERLFYKPAPAGEENWFYPFMGELFTLLKIPRKPRVKL